MLLVRGLCILLFFILFSVYISTLYNKKKKRNEKVKDKEEVENEKKK